MHVVMLSLLRWIRDFFSLAVGGSLPYRTVALRVLTLCLLSKINVFIEMRTEWLRLVTPTIKNCTGRRQGKIICV